LLLPGSPDAQPCELGLSPGSRVWVLPAELSLSRRVQRGAVTASHQLNDVKRKLFCIRDLGTNLISFGTKGSAVCDTEGEQFLCANIIAFSFSSLFLLQFHFKTIIIRIQKIMKFFLRYCLLSGEYI